MKGRIDNLKAFRKFVSSESKTRPSSQKSWHINLFTLGVRIRDTAKPLFKAVSVCLAGALLICAFFALLYYVIVGGQHDLVIPSYMNYLKDSILIFFNLPIFTKENNPIFADAFSTSTELIPGLATIMLIEKLLGLFFSAIILALVTNRFLSPVNVLWASPAAVVYQKKETDGRFGLRLEVRYWIRLSEKDYLNRVSFSLHLRENANRLATDRSRYPSFYVKRAFSLRRGIVIETVQLFEKDNWKLFELLTKALAFHHRKIILSEGIPVWVWNQASGRAISWNDELACLDKANDDETKEAREAYGTYAFDLLLAGTMPDGSELQLCKKYPLDKVLLGYVYQEVKANGKWTYTNTLRVCQADPIGKPEPNTSAFAENVVVSSDEIKRFFEQVKQHSDLLEDKEQRDGHHR